MTNWKALLVPIVVVPVPPLLRSVPWFVKALAMPELLKSVSSPCASHKPWLTTCAPPRTVTEPLVANHDTVPLWFVNEMPLKPFALPPESSRMSGSSSGLGAVVPGTKSPDVQE